MKTAVFRSSIAVAILTGLLTILMAALVARQAYVGRFNDELADPQLASLRQQLLQNPGDPVLTDQLRKLDLELRSQYFGRQRRAELAGPGLVVCGVLLVLSLNLAFWSRKKLPHPQGTGAIDVLNVGRLARWGIAVFGAAILTASVVLGLVIQPWSPPAREEPPTIAAKPASDEEMARNWPRFRGPGGLGVAHATTVPMDFDGASGKGILWKSPIPIGGDSSPIVWDKKVFVTGSSKKAREVYCYDADSGKMLWQKRVENVPGSSPLTDDNPMAGFAPSTPCTDGRLVFAIFPNMDLIALTLDGKEVWKKNVGPIEINYGYATSLLTVGDKLVLQMDQASDTDNKSLLLGLDTATGKEAWRVKRAGVGMSWASPITIDTPQGRQIVTAGLPFAISHDAATGKELWRAKLLEGEIAPSPAFGGGVVFIANKGAAISAIDPGGSGDVTKTHVKWAVKDEEAMNLPVIGSPVSDGKYVFMSDDAGQLSCLDAATGNKLYDCTHSGETKSSPTIVGDKLILLNTLGTVHFLKVGPKYELLGKASIGEPTTCSPAILDGRMYVRGEKNLICIGAGK